jgi:HlyD family secretion protein
MQLEHAVAGLTRARALFEKGLVTQQALDDAELQVAVRRTSFEAAKKTLTSTEANLNQARLNLNHAVIRSPIDGVVVNRLVDVGQTVQSSRDVAQFFTLATDLRQLRLEAAVDEADVGRIRPGMPVEFTVDSYARETFRGTVDTVTIDARTQSNVVTFPVWISVPNPDLKLRPSMTATVRILVAAARDVTRVPSVATRFRPTPAMLTALGLPVPEARRLQTADASAPASPAAAPGPASALTAATQIDEMFATVPQRTSAGAVWVWDDTSRTLTEKRVRLGISNGQLTALLEGDLTPGQQVVTNIVLASTTTATSTSQSVFGNAGRGGPGGGVGPGGFGPGGGGFGRGGGG